MTYGGRLQGGNILNPVTVVLLLFFLFCFVFIDSQLCHNNYLHKWPMYETPVISGHCLTSCKTQFGIMARLCHTHVFILGSFFKAFCCFSLFLGSSQTFQWNIIVQIVYIFPSLVHGFYCWIRYFLSPTRVVDFFISHTWAAETMHAFPFIKILWNSKPLFLYFIIIWFTMEIIRRLCAGVCSCWAY